MRSTIIHPHAVATNSAPLSSPAASGQSASRRQSGVFLVACTFAIAALAPAKAAPGDLYSANYYSLTKLSPATGGVIWSATPGGEQVAVAVSPLDGAVYSANHGANTVTRHDPQTGALVWTSPPAQPFTYVQGVAVSPIDGSVYSANVFSVTKLDPTDGHLLWTYNTGNRNYANSIVVSALDGGIYTAGYDRTLIKLSPVDGHLLWQTSAGPAGSSAIATNDSVGAIYVANIYGGTITMLDAFDGHLIWSSPVTGTYGIAADLLRGSVYSANQNFPYNPNFTDQLTKLDATTGNRIWTVATGNIYNQGYGVAVNPADGSVYSANSDSVTRIDPANGAVLWRSFPGAYPQMVAIDTSLAVDHMPPVLTVPANLVVEPTGPSGAVATFAATASDDSGSVTIVCSQNSGTIFPIGTTTVTVAASDPSGNTTSASFIITVRDTTAPALTVPANITAEATGPAGAAVSFAATATDAVGVAFFTYNPTSGSSFPIGTTTVHVTVADAAGNTSNGTFTVTVRDTTPPAITVPNPITAEATGPNGAAVSFSVGASDIVDGSVAAVASPASGSTFPLGVTTVTLTATDRAGNSATGNFTVTVRDTTAPRLVVPANQTLEATSAAGAGATFSATAVDAVALPTIAYSQASGSTFPLGTTTVNVTATDAAGNTSAGAFTITVVDTTPPVVTLNGPPTVVAACHTSFADAGASALDVFAGILPVTVLGAVNIDTVGTYTLTYSAVDPNGNIGTVTRTVEVVNSAPSFVAVNGPSGPLALGAAATLTVNFADPDAAQSHQFTINWDDGSTESFNLNPGVSSVTVTHTYTTTGVNAVRLTLDDGCATATTAYEFIVIYDPSGGFVTGGGWINSPAGAVTSNPSATGKATFGFVSKYLPGASVPSGNTEFQFQAASIRFKSTSYQWLVVAGARAQYKGTGTFNNITDCQFLLTATDGNLPGGGGIDKFRLKITKNDGVLYDNNPGASDVLDNANPQAIGGGSIEIRK